MKHPSTISIEDFNYHLPDQRIAKYPLAERDQSKLLVYQSGQIGQHIYKNLAEQLNQDCLLIFNNTKVVEARLLFQKPTGGVLELFCLEPADQYEDITSAMLQKGSVQWKCLVGGAKKWKDGALELMIEEDLDQSTKKPALKVFASKFETLPDCFLIQFSWEPAELSFAEVLHIAGDIPLPPYLNRATEESDKERYQTIYAKHDGSVAAPTAGLHFTENVFKDLDEKNISIAYVTLHVGAGTFKPVKAAQMKDHEMHAEYIDVQYEAIEQLKAHVEKGIIAVGTTSLRTLESLYWIGVKTIRNPLLGTADLQVSQWEPYENFDPSENTPKEYTAVEALQSLLAWMKRNKAERIITKTQIIIAPGYQFKMIRALITNFHQPQSTLLLLISAIVGDDWKKIYEFALANEYRFLSYGDGSILYVRN